MASPFPSATTTYSLRAVPTDIWLQFKARTAREGTSIRATLLHLLQFYSRYGLPKPPEEGAP